MVSDTSTEVVVQGRAVPAADDDWHHVEDAKKRKQIQDRLAQRARRKRLREAKLAAQSGPQPPATQHLHVRQGACDNGQDPAWTSAAALVPCARNAWTPAAIDAPDLVSIELTPEDLRAIEREPFNSRFQGRMASMLVQQPPFPMNVFGALYLNGCMLGLSCSTTIPQKSQPVADDVPLPLHPSPLQLVTIHVTWIDRFPFPKMRNNFINLAGIVDDEEFLFDIFSLPSFELVPGRAPWDPRAWKIHKVFAEKWGYLFF